MERKRKSGGVWWPSKRKRPATGVDPQIYTPPSSADLESQSPFKAPHWAPRKYSYAMTHRRRNARKALFQPSPMSMSSTAQQELDEQHALNDMKTFFKLVDKRQFPLSNLSFRLFLETVRWYALENTSQMRYSDMTMKFWKTGYSLLGNKFILLMSGSKNSNQLTTGDTSRGIYDPAESSINFAVPCIDSLRTFNKEKFPLIIKPGLIDQPESFCGKEDKDFILSMDGKKVVPGIDDKLGDVDLFGHEKHSTATQDRQRLDNELSAINEVINTVTVMSNMNVQEYTSAKIPVEESVIRLGERLRETRIIKEKQEAMLERLDEKSKDSSINNAYAYAMSSIRANIPQINEVSKRTLNVIADIASACSMMQKSSDFVSAVIVDRSFQNNWISLKPATMLSEQQQTDTRFIQQRTEQWFANMSKFKVTGSTLHNALGLRTLKEQKMHYDKVVHGIEQPFSDEVKLRMSHGTENEVNAIATLTGVILPFLHPQLSYVEVGSYCITSSNGDALILVSPDGVLKEMDSDQQAATSSPAFGCEIKCPAPGGRTTMYDTLPAYYVCQVLAEMVAWDLDKLLFVCYTKECTSGFLVQVDLDLWETIRREAERIYQSDKLQRPARTSPFAIETKYKLKEFVKTNVQFLGIFPSRTVSTTTERVKSIDDSPYLFAVEPPASIGNVTAVNDLIEGLQNAQSCTTDLFSLNRKKSTEVVVWLIQDTDRDWNPESPHSTPVAYALKGYTLTVETLRRMAEEVIIACCSNGKNIVGMSFDGQWVGLLNRDAKGKPLTLVQLQKDVWLRAKGTSKADILKFLQVVAKLKLMIAMLIRTRLLNNRIM